MKQAASWKTTLFGVLSGVGLLLASGQVFGDVKYAKDTGLLIAAVGATGQGIAGKDKDVTGGTR